MGTYKYLTGITINSISEGFKVLGCGLVSWIFQDYKRENIELIIEQVIYIPGILIQIIFSQHVAKQTGNNGDGSHGEKDKAYLIFG